MVVAERFLKEFQYNWGAPTIEFGRSKVEKVGEIAKNMGAKMILVVTDKGIVKAGICKKVTDSLESAGVEYQVFDKVQPNPLDTIVEEGVQVAKEIKCDMIIGLGGGSSIDTAKAISLIVTNPGSIRDYEVRTAADIGKIKNHPLPLITIPTTSGTGSEANFWAIVTNSERWNKMSIGGPAPYPGGPCIAPRVAIVDPELTVTLPPSQTAFTGADAFAHALEAYTANVANPISDALSEYAMRIIAEYLPIAYTNGKDIEAREMMSLAACLGGIAFANSDCAGIHALGEALGGLYGNPPKPVIPHGVCCGLFMPWMVEYNYRTNPVKFAKIAQILGEKVEGLPLWEAAEKSVDAIKKFLATLDMPRSLKELGVKEEDLPAIAERTMWNVSVGSNPRPLTYDVALNILKKAYEGWEL